MVFTVNELGQLNIHSRRNANNANPYLTPCTETSSREIRDLDEKGYGMLLEGNAQKILTRLLSTEIS